MLYLVARKKILNVTEYLKNNSEKDRSGTRPHTNTDISLPVYLQSWWQAVSGLGNNAFPPRYMSMSIWVLSNQTTDITSGDTLPKYISLIDGTLNYQYIDENENKIFLIYKEIQMGSVTQSYMRKSFLIYEERRKYLTIYMEAGR
jgi:hypothetical protein